MTLLRNRAVFAAAVLILTGCSVGDTDERRSPKPSDRPAPSATLDERPFEQLEADQPGGPHHLQPVPSRPSIEQLHASSQRGPHRPAAEAFAILVNHALEDQTPGSPGDDVLGEFGQGLPSAAAASVGEARSLPGNRVVPGSRSFVRSSLSATATGANATVFVVEKIESPALGDVAGQPFVFWAQTRLTLTWAGGRWKLVDYQSAAASEYPRFSEWAWRGTMDSGRDWRRFDVAE